MIVGERIRLYPTKEQEEIFIQNCHAARFCYNACLAEMIRAFEEDGYIYSFYALSHFVSLLKYQDANSWLLSISSGIPEKAARDVRLAFDSFYHRGCKGFPKFKKKGKCKMSFGLKTDKWSCRFVDGTHIKIARINDPVRIRRHIIIDNLKNPRITFDGKYWYLSFAYELEPLQEDLTDEVIGIDLGIKNLATLSNGVVYKSINNDSNILKLEK